MEVRTDFYLYFLALVDDPFVVSRKRGGMLWMVMMEILGGKSVTDPVKFNLMTLCSSACIMFQRAVGSLI
jgi:hypothetical protein